MNTTSHRVYQTGEGEKRGGHERPRTSENQANLDAAPLMYRKFGEKAASESVWYGIFNLVRQTSLSSTGPAVLCDTGVAADSDAAPLMCRT